MYYRNVGEVMLHRALLAAARLVFVDGLLELGQIVQPLLTALGAQRLFIPALVQNIREHLRDGPPLIRVRKALDRSRRNMYLLSSRKSSRKFTQQENRLLQQHRCLTP